MKKVYLLFLALIFAGGYFLRVMYLPKNILTFGYDQARDGLVTNQILKGDLKIQGPSASTPGLYHGIFYNYFLAPAYFFGNGSPIAAAYWIAFLNSLTVFVIFWLTYLITKKPKAAILSAFLFSISFEATQYATWLSNPTIAIFTVPLIYLGLWGWTQEKSNFWKSWGPVICGIGLGLSIQAEIFLSYHLVPVVIWLIVSKKKISKKQILAFIALLLLSVSTMIISEVKFGFKGFDGIKLLLTGSEVSLAYAKSVGDYLVLYLNQIGRIFAFNSYPGNIGLGGGFVIILGIFGIVRKNISLTFLATWLFSHITVVSVGGVTTPFLMVGIGPAVSVILAYYLYTWWENKNKIVAIGILLLMIYGNISMILKENSKGSTLFAIQKDMLLTKQMSLIDYTYGKSNGGDFSVNSLTSPLWVNVVWDYLYKWYGESKYGYLPSWHGRSQIGQMDRLQEVSKSKDTSFLILEPMGGIPTEYLGQTLDIENSYSKVVDEKYFGELRVQERKAIKK